MAVWAGNRIETLPAVGASGCDGDLVLSRHERRAATGRLERGMTNRGFDGVVAGAFWTLGVLCLLSLNDVTFMWFGIERAFSVPMLLCCLVVLLGLLRVRPLEVLGGMGVLLMAALVSYVGTGILVAFATGTELQTDAASYLRRYTSSILVILATAVGGRIVLQRSGSERTLLSILAILTASCTLILASPRLLLLFQNPPVQGEYRYFGPFSNPNEAGFVACLAVALAFSLIRASRFRLLAYGSLFVAVYALIGTYSRTSLVILPVLMVGGVLVTRGAERWRLMAGLAVVAWVGAGTMADAIAGILLDPQITRLNSLVRMVETLSFDDVTLEGRLALWQLGTEQVLASPLYGNGLGQLHSLDGAWYNGEGVLLGVHNQYLTLWGEAGLIPVILFVLFLAGMLLFGIKRRTDVAVASAVSGWAMVILLTGMTSHSMLLSRPANFILGFSCAAAAFAGSRRETADRSIAISTDPVRSS